MAYRITFDEFLCFRTLIYDESGISRGDQKQTLLASRLLKRLRDRVRYAERSDQGGSRG